MAAIWRKTRLSRGQAACSDQAGICGQSQSSTAEGVLLAHRYPRIARYPRGHYRHLWRAASKIYECLGRLPRGRPNVWAIKDG